MRIAVIQFQIAHLDRVTNFARIEHFIASAKQRHADVVVFPEDCITSSIFGDLSQLDTTKTVRDTFRRLAKTYAVDIVTGSCMEGAVDGNFNTSYYIDGTGDVLCEYRKNHLYPSEHAFLTPGTGAPVFATKFGNVGIVICWDMLSPEIFARMKAQGVDIIYCPSYWYREIADGITKRDPASEEHLLDALCLTRAVETNAVLIYCNAAGVATFPNGSIDTLIGHSQVVLPGQGAIKRLDHNDETMLIADVDASSLAESARIYCA